MVEFKNIMEEIVLERVLEVVETMGYCTCDQCVLDAASYALNRLPSKYACSKSGALLLKIDFMNAQKEAEITATVVQAVQVVHNNPHHQK